MSKKYTAGDMEKKTAIDHVRTYPSMYFGGKGASGVFQSVKEIVSNSTDEALSGFGNVIEVTLLTPTKVSVRDYGRGIPTDINFKYGETGVEMAMQLNSGGKYDKKNYNTSGGMHGVGLSVTNCLSTKMSVTVWQNGKIYYSEYSKGHKTLPKETGKLKILGDCPKNMTGTEVTWELDPEVMNVVEFDASSIIDLMRTNAFINSKVAYRFVDKRKPNEEPKIMEFLSENGLSDFIEYLREDRTKIIDNCISYTGLMSDDDQFEISFTYIQDYKSEVHLYVNRNLIPNGGTAILGFRTGLAKAINDAAKELGILKDKDKPFSTSDIDEGLIAVINLSMKYPELDGQTKNKLMNASARSDLYNSTASKISAYLEEHVVELGKIAQKILLGRKAREASQRARDIVLKETTDKLAGPTKLRDCLSKKADDCEIYLVEGDSAASGMIGRDVQSQAYLALRGKVKNVEKCGGVKGALDNNEIRSMIHAFGCGVGDSFDITKLRYGKIIIMTDADPDGAHIRALLMTFLYRLSPELFSEGKVYVCISPLYKITMGKDVTFYVSTDEFEKASNDLKEKGKSFVPSRFKGLGEMMPADLRDTCLNKDNRRLIRISVENAMVAEEVVRKLMASDEVISRKAFFQSNGDLL